MGDEALSELAGLEKRATAERWVDKLADASAFGALLEGIPAHGVVVEVRKGNFMTRMSTPAPEEATGTAARGTGGAAWKAGDVLRTFVRGTLQQFDLGLASLVAPGDEVELIVPPREGEQDLVQHGLHGMLTRVYP
ncbi:MAG: hypothetical protein NTW87_31030, partial [Planctomycetota bacterium]|nr:hypothetical protein [Planctomycetota bacterium]